MRLPAPLLRNNPNAYKNQFGHVLIIAGSRGMLGAASLSALAAMRAGAGLVTIGVAQSLNETLQKKVSPVIMTWPLSETKEKTIAQSALSQIRKNSPRYQSLAIGPGLSQNISTKKLVLKIIAQIPLPTVIDADALNALAAKPEILLKNTAPKILTPHVGEMARLTGLTSKFIEANRESVAKNFAQKYHCIVLLKGQHTTVTGPDKKIYHNNTGNAGMATAGSGDVLTGIISAFLAQGIPALEAACWAAYVHGLAGDWAAKTMTPISMIATDIIDYLPAAFQQLKGK